MAKYEVIAPLAYGRRTDKPTYRRDRASEEVVRCDVGDVIELDDSAAFLLQRKIKPYIEPSKPSVLRRKTTRLKASDTPDSGPLNMSREDVDFGTPPNEEQDGDGGS